MESMDYDFQAYMLFESMNSDMSNAQKIFETKLVEICEEIKNLNISENLVYAGGCALNSLANKKIYDLNYFKFLI